MFYTFAWCPVSNKYWTVYQSKAAFMGTLLKELLPQIVKN